MPSAIAFGLKPSAVGKRLLPFDATANGRGFAIRTGKIEQGPTSHVALSQFDLLQLRLLQLRLLQLRLILLTFNPADV